MRLRPDYDLPRELEPIERRARRLESATLFFLTTIVVVMYLAMGSSQAMKAAWVEDMLSFVPAIAFLIAMRYTRRRATEEYPYGFHSSVAIAFLAGSVALSIFGFMLLVDSVIGLVRQEHVSIGGVVIFGRTIWAGWVMIAALVYSAIAPFILGRMKHEPARELHDKTLMADSDMNRADWMTAGAGVAGILGIGMGWWWADSVAAGIISIDVLHDGLKNLKQCVADLIDQQPHEVDGERSDVPERVLAALRDLAWVVEADLRMREEGHVFAGEVFLVVTDTDDMPDKLEQARRTAHDVDWRVRDLVFEIEDVTD
ncbi:MAG TPA: cation diffusion facilitator family transporter [Longimicrobiales bacterium]